MKNQANSFSVISTVRHGECQKNQAAAIGGYATDGCREFMLSGEEGTDAALTCTACAIHMSFHQRWVETQVVGDCTSYPTEAIA